MPSAFSVGLTGDFRGPGGQPVYRDIGLDALEGAPGIAVFETSEDECSGKTGAE